MPLCRLRRRRLARTLHFDDSSAFSRALSIRWRLFLDDLQWLDAATLDFLEDLLVQEDLAHLLVVGAYRDNEVDPAHPLMRKLAAIRRSRGEQCRRSV